MKKEFEGNYVKKCYDNVCVIGSMQASHHASIRVRVYPKNFHDLTTSVQNNMQVSKEKYEEFARILFDLHVGDQLPV